jgi:hypothetical protein
LKEFAPDGASHFVIKFIGTEETVEDAFFREVFVYVFCLLTNAQPFCLGQRKNIRFYLAAEIGHTFVASSKGAKSACEI